MEPFKVHILGCGSALPTLRHNPSSQVVEVRGKMFMVDCGEGTQLQLRRVKVRFTKVSAVFISHLHGDHCFGLIGMISTFGMLGRTAALHIYAYKDLNDILQRQIEYFCNGLEYDIVFHAIDPTKHAVVYEDKSVSVETVPLVHRVPCCGFIFREKPTLPHIRRDMIDFLQIPLHAIGRIKGGEGWTDSNGRFWRHEELTLPAEPARRYAYCSDTMPVDSNAEMLKGVDVLFHEATFLSDAAVRARQTGHSTAAQAAAFARRAEAKRLVIGHFSSRYTDDRLLLNEAAEIFPDVVLAYEGLKIEV